MPVFSATAIQISGVSTPSISRVTIDCFTGSSFSKCVTAVQHSLKRTNRHPQALPREGIEYLRPGLTEMLDVASSDGEAPRLPGAPSRACHCHIFVKNEHAELIVNAQLTGDCAIFHPSGWTLLPRVASGEPRWS